MREVDDALVAAAAGADAIGMVFHPGAARCVSTNVAEKIVAALPPFVSLVALLVDPSVEHAVSTAAQFGNITLQLHGHESAALLRQIPRRLLKAVRVDRKSFETELAMWRDEIAAGGLDHLRGLVLETAGPGLGGTGQANDWDFIQSIAAKNGFDGLPPIIAAGGLTPDNVGDVVRLLRPYAVDVSSGVERVKGKKDRNLIERFIAAVREADGM